MVVHLYTALCLTLLLAKNIYKVIITVFLIYQIFLNQFQTFQVIRLTTHIGYKIWK